MQSPVLLRFLGFILTPCWSLVKSILLFVCVWSQFLLISSKFHSSPKIMNPSSPIPAKPLFYSKFDSWSTFDHDKHNWHSNLQKTICSLPTNGKCVEASYLSMAKLLAKIDNCIYIWLVNGPSKSSLELDYHWAYNFHGSQSATWNMKMSEISISRYSFDY